jgi:hypothetical protein
MARPNEYWEIWFPQAGATGLPFARCRVAKEVAGNRVLVHAAPPVMSVTVRDESGTVTAQGDNLGPREPGPMSFLNRRGEAITLENGWPSERDLGRLVLLPGGEAGILKTWWHANDHSEWRWQVEFYNRR